MSGRRRLVIPLVWVAAALPPLGAADANGAPAPAPTPTPVPATVTDHAAAPIRCLQAWARATQATALTGAVYLTIANDTDQAVALTAATTASANHIELHTTTTDAHGLMHMSEVAAFTVPAHGTLVLRPDESHLMLIGLSHGLTIGSHLPLTVTVGGTPLAVEAIVRPAGSMSYDD